MRVRNEDGIYVPILAVIGLTLVGALTFLGIRPALIKYTNTDLRYRLDALCDMVSTNPMIQGEGVETFFRTISDWDLPEHIKLTEATLVMPTLPRDLSTNPGDILAAHLSSAQIAHCPTGVACHFYGDAELYPRPESLPTVSGNPSTAMSPSFWIYDSSDRNSNAGNGVLCELKARFIDTGLFSVFKNRPNSNDNMSDAEMTIRASYWRPPINWYANSPETLQEKIDSRGLSIIVAPHMTTNPLIRHFRFPSQTKYEPYDPLRGSVLGGTFQTEVEKFTSSPGPPIHQTPGGLVIPATPVVANARNTTRRGAAIPFPGSDLAQIYTACMNPAVLVRNVYLSTIISLASRTAHFRTETGIYLAGTQHRIKRNNAPSDLPYFFNQPIEMVRKGTDIMQRNYQLPFITFYNGILNDPTGGRFTPVNTSPLPLPTLGSNDPNHGWILPFNDTKYTSSKYNLSDVDSSDIQSDLAQMKTIISSQLRYCYHLYLNENGDGLDLTADINSEIYPESLNTQPDQKNDDFEGNEYEVVESLSPSEVDSWSQGYGSSSTGGPWDSFPAPSGGPVNAYELVKMIGTIQMCPYEAKFESATQNFFPEDPLVTDNTHNFYCAKPSIPAPTSDGTSVPHDLQPDLIGAMLAITGGSIDYIHPGLNAAVTPSDSFRAIRSPGLFDPIASYDINSTIHPFDIFSPSSYAPPINTAGNVDNSIIMIVTHQPISNNDVLFLRTLIQTISTSNTAPFRPVIIVYIPTNLHDADPTVTNRFRDILGLLDTDPWGVGTNEFVELSPYAADYWDDESGSFTEYNNSEDGFNFIDFWDDMLSQDDDVSGIIERAWTTFFDDILDKETRL